jgi:head-tail adaptor
MLSNSELEYMREAIGQLLPDTCNILTVTNTPNGFGGMTQTWGTASASVACRLDIVNRGQDAESIQASGIRAYQEVMLSLPYDTTITTSQRVEHGGYTYNVHSVNTDQSWIAVKRAVLERV